MLTANPSFFVGYLRLGIFSFSANYAEHMGKNASPDMIYDIDMDPPHQRSAVMTPVEDAVRSPCVLLSALKAPEDKIIFHSHRVQ